MEDDIQDDFDYLDDADLDDLPAKTLQELEQRALSSTQQMAGPRQVNTSRNHGLGVLQASNSNGVPPKSNQSFGDPSSSDYGFEDEDVIDLDAPQPAIEAHSAKPNVPLQVDPASAREQWRHQRYAIPSKLNPAVQSRPLESDGTLPTTSNKQLNGRPSVSHQQRSAKDYMEVNGDTSVPAQDIIALQARISELERERASLHQLNEQSRNSALSKAGEIAIVRSNQDKMTRNFEKRLAELQDRHAEQVAKQKAELEAARKDQEKVETNNKFLEHDLLQEAERTRNARRTLKDTHGNTGPTRAQVSPAATPKKNRFLPFRDGFNDDEAVMLSPSKAKERLKPSTPKAGAKRKRAQPPQSPSKSLSFNETQNLADDGGETGLANLDLSQEAAAPPSIQDTRLQDDRYQFVETVLDSWSETKDERLMETLTKYSLPSASSKSVASILFDALSPGSTKSPDPGLRVFFCNTMMTLWKQCLDERYYDPLHDLTDLLYQIIILAPSSMCPSISPELVPLCLATSDLIAVPTAKASRNPSCHQPPSAEVKALVEPSEYLDLLRWVSLNCELHQGSLEVFWSAMEFDFVLLMLHKSQPLSQIIQMLHLLASSVLPTSFGAILASSPETDRVSIASRQSKNESDVLDRLTLLLFETPEIPMSSTQTEQSAQSQARRPNIATALLSLRASILALLKRLCFTVHGGRAIATHRLAIGRLVRFLHDCIVDLYNYTPETHALTTSLINETVMLLAHSTACHAEVLDVRARLAAVPGGSYKYLVALSRVAFAEGASVIEEGIDSEAAEQAHRMLDEHLSPEEGDAVISVFSSGR